MEASNHAIYINARVRGMKSGLFSRQQLDDLLDQNDVRRISDVLVDSPYEQEMAEALTHLEGVDAIEEGVSRNLVNTLQRLLSMVQPPMRDYAAIFLQRWDLFAVKSLLRARHHGLSAVDATDALFPGATLSVPVLKSLAELESVEALVGGLAAWNTGLCGPLSKALGDYEEQDDVTVLEDALDKAYFIENRKRLAETSDEDAKLVAKLLDMEIDRINLRTMMMLPRNGMEPAEKLERLLPGGLIHRRVFEAMASARDEAEMLDQFGETPYRDLVERLYMFVQSGRFAPMDREFDRLILEDLNMATRVHAFTIAILMYYAWLKYNEMVNLRMIARGTERHLPRGQVREEVFYA